MNEAEFVNVDLDLLISELVSGDLHDFSILNMKITMTIDVRSFLNLRSCIRYT